MLEHIKKMQILFFSVKNACIMWAFGVTHDYSKHYKRRQVVHRCIDNDLLRRDAPTGCWPIPPEPIIAQPPTASRCQSFITGSRTPVYATTAVQYIRYWPGHYGSGPDTPSGPSQTPQMTPVVSEPLASINVISISKWSDALDHIRSGTSSLTPQPTLRIFCWTKHCGISANIATFTQQLACLNVRHAMIGAWMWDNEAKIG